MECESSVLCIDKSRQRPENVTEEDRMNIKNRTSGKWVRCLCHEMQQTGICLHKRARVFVVPLLGNILVLLGCTIEHMWYAVQWKADMSCTVDELTCYLCYSQHHASCMSSSAFHACRMHPQTQHSSRSSSTVTHSICTLWLKNRTPVIFSNNFNKYWSVSIISVEIISNESPVFTCIT